MSAQTKIALVTGGSRSLGKDMATSIALKGIDVILTYRSNEAVAIQTLQSIKAISQKVVAIQLDMTDSTSIDSFVKQVLENRFLS